MIGGMGGVNVLVVGGAGFVGSNLVKMLLQEGAAKVVVVDNLLSSERENLPFDPRLDFREGDIADNQVLAEITDAFDYIFHLACFHGNQNSIYDPLADNRHSAFTTLKLFWHIREFKKVRKVIYVGAGCAVAEKDTMHAQPTKEDAPISLKMDSPYSISKLLGEFYSVYFHSHHGMPITRARFQNVYGPGEVLGAGRWRGTAATVWRNVIPTFTYKALHGEALPLYNNGAASRDFIFVEDICRGLILCALHGKAGDVYNLSSGVETTIYDLAMKINTLAGNKTPCLMLPPRPWDHSLCRVGCPRKAKAEIGFVASVPLEEGLRKTIEWTRENLSRIEEAIQKHAKWLSMEK